MKKAILLLLLSSFIGLFYCQLDDLESYITEKYIINYPANWSLSNSGQMGIEFIIFSKPQSKEDKFRENINLIIQDLHGKDIDLDAYTNISNAQLENMITDYHNLKNVRLKRDGLTYQKVIYKGKQGVFNLMTTQYYWIHKEHAYILTFSSKEEDYELFKKEGELILNSFVIKD